MFTDDDLVIKESEAEVDNTEEMVEEEVIENAETSESVENAEPETIQDDEDEEDRIVTIGDSPAEEGEADEEVENHQETPKWVKTLRKVNRKQESEIKRLKRQLEANQKTAETEKPVELGEKPTLASSGYDDKKYEQDLISYYERKRKVEEQEAEKARIIEQQNQEWADRQRLYVEKKKQHGFKDFAEAEELVSNTLSETQQGIMVEAADDAALVAYALGKNPKKLEELAGISNPIRFTAALAKLEAQLKVTSRKAPNPEKRINTGKSGGTSGSSDSTLERLREEAARTGNYTKVREYKDQLRKRKG